MANEGYHEPIAELSDKTRDMHRAIISLMEELEAARVIKHYASVRAAAAPPEATIFTFVLLHARAAP